MFDYKYENMELEFGNIEVDSQLAKENSIQSMEISNGMFLLMISLSPF